MKMCDLIVAAAVFVVLLGVNFGMGALLDYFDVPISALLVIIIIALQAMFLYMNVHSSRLSSVHLVSSLAWCVVQVGVIFALTDWENFSIMQWIVSFSPMVLSIIPPIFYRKSTTDNWVKPLMAVYLVYTLALVHYLHGTGFYQVYTTLQMLVTALAILALQPKKACKTI